MHRENLHILVIEDNPGDYFLVKDYLEEALPGILIKQAENITEATGAIREQEFDTILLDLTLPDGMGLETFIAINKIAPNTPIIILTGLQDTDIALESVKNGAQDYIVKDKCDANTLYKSINYAIERTKINDRLKKSEAQYKYLFNHNPLPMWAYDKSDLKILMVNGAAVEHYGYSEEEFLAMSMYDIGYSQTDSNEEVTSTPRSRELKHKKKDGSYIEVEMAQHDIIVEGRDACLAVIHDITERNRAREQLRQSEQMFRTISENFPNGAVAIIDKNLRIQYIAGKEFYVMGLNPADYTDTDFSAHFSFPSQEIVEKTLHQVFKGHDTVFEASQGQASYMLSAVPLRESDGSIEKIIVASQNISTQKNNEKEREILIEELTQNNTDLRQFSYITSHNLRAPLSNLLGIINLLNTSTITDPVNQMLLKNFEECTLQLNETVNDLINVLIIKNNVNAGREILDIQKIFDRVTHSIQSTINKFEMDIEVHLDEANEVTFNHTYLESIFLNLLTNAIKYRSPKRKPRVVLKSSKTHDGVKLFFSDNGLGIDLDRYRDRIFGLYQRFHDHADSKGLGLYIVNSQVRVMGGEIDIESEVDKGTTFILSFKN